MSDNTTGLTAERFERIKLSLSDYGGLTREEGMLLVARIEQLEQRLKDANQMRRTWRETAVDTVEQQGRLHLSAHMLRVYARALLKPVPEDMQRGYGNMIDRGDVGWSILGILGDVRGERDAT